MDRIEVAVEASLGAESCSLGVEIRLNILTRSI